MTDSKLFSHNAIRTVSVGSPRYLTIGSLLGLVLGLGLGAVANATGNGALEWLGSAVAPLGEAWTRALLMIVIPLVTSYLFVSVAGLGRDGAAARVGGLSLVCFVGLLLFAGAMTVAASGFLMDRAPVTDGAFTAMAAEAAAADPVDPAVAAPSNPVEWLAGLIPSNPFQAAASGDILAVLIFTILFAMAATRLADDARQLLVGIAAAVAETSMVLIRWILVPIPLAVFALAYPMAAATGLSIAGALAWFIGVTCVLLVAFTIVLYPVTWLLGGIPMGRFARGVAPAQMVAVGTRSSLASLPAMVVASDEGLGLDPRTSNLVLPLAVSAFKVNRTITSPFKLLFLAHVYGLVISPEYLVVFVGTVVLLSFSSPGIPSGGFFVTLPFYLAAGIPVEGVVLLKAVDAVPDVFKTLVNVTADLSVAAIVARVLGRRPAAVPDPDLAPAVPAGLADPVQGY